MPQAAQASRSACMPIRLRSRQQKCSMVSMPASRWMRSAVISGEMRELARGPSGMLIADDAALAERAALGHDRGEIVAAGRHQLDGGDPLPRGQPAAELGLCSAKAAGGFSGTGSCDFAAGTTRGRLSGLIARAISRMCSGVVPQQPPTAETPRAT